VRALTRDEFVAEQRKGSITLYVKQGTPVRRAPTRSRRWPRTRPAQRRRRARRRLPGRPSRPRGLPGTGAPPLRAARARRGARPSPCDSPGPRRRRQARARQVANDLEGNRQLASDMDHATLLFTGSLTDSVLADLLPHRVPRLGKLLEAAGKPGFHSLPLDVRLDVHFRTHPTTVLTHNVIGVVPGVDAGLVVCVAAGNNGKDSLGNKIYGAIHRNCYGFYAISASRFASRCSSSPMRACSSSFSFAYLLASRRVTWASVIEAMTSDCAGVSL